MDIKAYTGASFNNLSHGESQGTQIIFIGNEERQRRLIQWNSSKIKYVRRPSAKISKRNHIRWL